MKKSQLAHAFYIVNRSPKLVTEAERSLQKILSETFSTLVTLNPALALDSVKQLNEQINEETMGVRIKAEAEARQNFVNHQVAQLVNDSFDFTPEEEPEAPEEIPEDTPEDKATDPA